MKRDYIALWSILAVAFILFLCLSTYGDVSVGSVRIKSANFFEPFALASAPAPVDSDTLVIVKPKRARQVVLDGSTPKTILIIGDSMLEGLTPRLAAYCDASGHKLYSVIWYSSTSETYGESHLLSDYIRTLNPDYIFISLGGNELFVSDIQYRRDQYVKSIIQEIGDIPYLWIGPPNWKQDTGINDLVRGNVPKGCFFTSNGMHFDRKRDGAHPTASSAVQWMDSVIRWMPQHAKYYLPFDAPENPKGRAVKLFIHQPGPLTERPK